MLFIKESALCLGSKHVAACCNRSQLKENLTTSNSNLCKHSGLVPLSDTHILLSECLQA